MRKRAVANIFYNFIFIILKSSTLLKDGNDDSQPMSTIFNPTLPLFSKSLTLAYNLRL